MKFLNKKNASQALASFSWVQEKVAVITMVVTKKGFHDDKKFDLWAQLIR